MAVASQACCRRAAALPLCTFVLLPPLHHCIAWTPPGLSVLTRHTAVTPICPPQTERWRRCLGRTTAACTCASPTAAPSTSTQRRWATSEPVVAASLGTACMAVAVHGQEQQYGSTSECPAMLRQVEHVPSGHNPNKLVLLHKAGACRCLLPPSVDQLLLPRFGLYLTGSTRLRMLTMPTRRCGQVQLCFGLGNAGAIDIAIMRHTGGVMPAPFPCLSPAMPPEPLASTLTCPFAQNAYAMRKAFPTGEKAAAEKAAAAAEKAAADKQQPAEKAGAAARKGTKRR